MKIIIIFTFVASILLGCKNRNQYQCSIDENIVLTNDSIIAAGSLTNDINRWLITDFNEPILKDLEAKSYRLAYHRGDSFKLKSTIRFTKKENGAELTVKNRLSEDYKNQYSLSDTTYHKFISTEKWNNLEKVINSNCYWTMPTLGSTSPYNTFFLEAYAPKKNNPIERDYHIVVRSFPSDSTAFGQILTEIFSFTDSDL